MEIIEDIVNVKEAERFHQFTQRFSVLCLKVASRHCRLSFSHLISSMVYIVFRYSHSGLVEWPRGMQTHL